jgi:hydrogenase maturation protease
MSRGILVAGVGNIFLGDDAFGVEVVRRLDAATLGEGVTVADFGIAGLHLAYELLEGYDGLVLVDAMNHGDPPGTLTVLEPDRAQPNDAGPGVVDAHGLTPEAVLSMLDDLGGHVDRVVVVGCEPAILDEQMGLSETVAAVLDDAVALVCGVVQEMSVREMSEHQRKKVAS